MLFQTMFKMKDKYFRKFSINGIEIDEPLVNFVEKLKAAESTKLQLQYIDQIVLATVDAIPPLCDNASKILLCCLVQCPLGMNVATKITRSILKMQGNFPESFQDYIAQLIAEYGDDHLPLCHLLNTSVATELKTSQLFLLFCGAVEGCLKRMHSETFINSCPNAEVSSNQQNIQHLVTSAFSYFNFIAMKPDFNITCVNASIDEIRTLCFSIISSEVSSLDLRINTGHFLVVLSYFGLSSPIKFLSSMANCSEEFDDVVDSEIAKLSIFHGVICSVTPHDLFSMQVTGCNASAGAYMLQIALQLCLSSNSNESVVSSIRIVNHVMSRLLATDNGQTISSILNVNSEIEDTLLRCIWFTWEHYLDRVKHTTQETFQNYLASKNIMLNENNRELFFMNVFQSQIDSIPAKKSAITAVRCLVKYLPVKDIIASFPDLAVTLVSCLFEFSKAGACLDTLKTLITKHSTEVQCDKWQEYWVALLVQNFVPDMMTFGFELLMKSMIVTRPSCATYMIDIIVKQASPLQYDQMILLIACVKMAKEVNEKSMKKDEIHFDSQDLAAKVISVSDKWKNCLNYGTMQACLLHVDERVQILSFGLLSESKRPTDIYNPTELKLILEFFENGLCVESPAQRQLLSASAKKMFTRIRDSSNALLRIQTKMNDFPQGNHDRSISNVSHIIGCYSSFCNDLFRRLIDGLQQDCPYPERTVVLTTLSLYQSIVLNCSEVKQLLNLLTLSSHKMYVNSLIEVLGDNYESNKIIVLKILKDISCSELPITDLEVSLLLDYVVTMASSSKPPIILTASYILLFIRDHESLRQRFVKSSSDESKPQSLLMCSFILSELKRQVSVASESLLVAACSAPMYGLLSLIYSLLQHMDSEEGKTEAWKEFICELIDTCLMARETVKAVVENECPEGNIPLDHDLVSTVVQSSIGVKHPELSGSLDSSSVDSVIKAQSVTSQTLLLCAWRTIKEISLIFGDLLHQFNTAPDAHAVIDFQTVKKMGDYFLTVMAETKHRGAFEQAYTGFLRMCEKLWQYKDPQLSKLPEKWVENILLEIEAVDEEKFCATRRSAGIPFIVQSILATEPSVRGCECLRQTMTRLLAMANDPNYDSSYVKLHVFNILRSLYRDTKLGEHIIPFVSEGVKVAIEGFCSKWWPIRNVSTLLFSALISRMFGVKKNRDDLHQKNAMSASVFFYRYNELYSFLLNTLQSGATEILKGYLAPSIYPILLLLARLNPSPLSSTTTSVSLSSFVSPVLVCSRSPIYQLRELSAKALPSLVSSDGLGAIVSQLCEMVRSESANAVHGALLSLVQLLTKFHNLKAVSEEENILHEITHALQIALKSTCFVIKNVCFELNFCMLDINPSYKSTLNSSELEKEMHYLLENYSEFKHHPGFEKYISMFTRYTLSDKRTLLSVDDITSSSSVFHFLSQATRITLLSAIIDSTPVPIGVLYTFLKEAHAADSSGIRSTVYRGLLKQLQRLETLSEQEETHLLSLCRDILEENSDSEAETNPDELGHLITLLMQALLRLGVKHHSLRERFCHKLVCHSNADKHLKVRVAASVASSSLLRDILLCQQSSNIEQNPCLPLLLHSLCIQVQDDEYSVRSNASQVWTVFTSLASREDTLGQAALQTVQSVHCHSVVQSQDYSHLHTLRSRQLLGALVRFGATLSPEASTTFLLKLVLCNEEEAFGLSQDSDRAFDNSEASVLMNRSALCLLVADVVTLDSVNLTCREVKTMLGRCGELGTAGDDLVTVGGEKFSSLLLQEALSLSYQVFSSPNPLLVTSHHLFIRLFSCLLLLTKLKTNLKLTQFEPILSKLKENSFRSLSLSLMIDSLEKLVK